MDSSTKRKVGAIALIVAGIGAFLVPFLLHGPALQASNNGGGNTNNNNNNGGATSSCTTNCSPPTNPPTCASDDPVGPSGHTDEGLHLAKGHDKHPSIASKAQGFFAALGAHDPHFDATHSTKTDNETTNTHGLNSNAHVNDNDACADDDHGNNA